MDRVFLSALLCLDLFILVWRRFSWRRVIKENAWLMLLIGYMLLSILWSDIPYISFKRWIREFTAITMAFLVATEPDPRQAVESVLRRTAYILIPFSVLLILYFPIYGRVYHRWSGELMWVGVNLQKNGLGRLCIICALFLVWTLAREWRRRDIPVGKLNAYADLFVLIITLWLLKGPPGVYPATATVALGAGLAMFFTLRWMKKYHIYLGANILAAIMAIIIALGVAAPIVGTVPAAGVSVTLGREETLTGRTEIWSDLLPKVMQQPILGGGFGGFWTPTTREKYNIGEAHSGYLEVLLDGGFVALLLLSVFLLSFGRRAQREMRYDFDWGSLCISYLVMVLIHSISESTINSFTNHLTAVLLFLSLSFPNNPRPPET
jgi:O-antigen ligase